MPGSSIPAKRSADAEEAAWVADEDRFVLHQTRKKSVIRAKSGRAQPIDWLNVMLAVLDPERNPVDDELDDDMDIMDPQVLFEQLSDADLADLEKKIIALQNLESSRSNRDYWTMMATVCRDRRTESEASARSARGITSVSADVDKLLKPKSLPELEKLERQINTKLNSNQAIDTDYWEHLLQSLLIYKAKAKLKAISQTIHSTRNASVQKQQAAEAAALRTRLLAKLDIEGQLDMGDTGAQLAGERHALDPEPMLRLRNEDKTLDSIDLAAFQTQLSNNRKTVLSHGHVIGRDRSAALAREHAEKRQKLDETAQSLAFDREVARGLGENEEVFTTEEEVQTKDRHLWADKYRPRKPQYFNRVSLGFEWNKYNQTHYDQDNPPPKVVQGYKFNIFYPDLAGATKAPRYRIERDDGRKRGETLAPAGEEDTCIIRFIAGPPYEDLAFRIVDREWDYSAKRERGFKSSFDKGVLQLTFHFKKIYYRK